MKTSEIAEFVGGQLHGDGDVDITSVASFGDAIKGQIAFLEKPVEMLQSEASCVILPSVLADQYEELRSGRASIISVPNPKLAFARIAAFLHPKKASIAETHDSALISPSAKIGTDVSVGAFSTVGSGSIIGDRTRLDAGVRLGDNVTIGSNCLLHPNVVVEDNCTIGNGVILHSGVVIGADGFGYVREENGVYNKFPQIGKVVIEDNVEIGANTCIDRGALGVTRIGEGTKIDNLVQVGHNVEIGKRCVIAAQTGISGSVVIEDDCVIGGQVGFGDHVRVLSGAVIGSQAGVLPGKIVRPGVWWGTPIQPLDEFKRRNAHINGIERLKGEVKELKRKLAELLDRH